MLIVNAQVEGRPHLRVRAGERIEAIDPDLQPLAGELVHDARGGAVIPGLHDHHIHLRALIAASTSVRLDGVVGPAALRERLTAAGAGSGARGPIGPPSWLRAVGYLEARMGPLDRDELDQLVGSRPIRVQSSSGELWILNSAALASAGVDGWTGSGIERDLTGRPTGRLWRMDDRLRAAIGSVTTGDQTWRAFSERAAATGITGFTDATVDRTQADIDDLALLIDRGVIGQRLMLMSPGGSLPRPGIELGPHKIVLDDLTLPTGPELAATISRVHRVGTVVAVHCVTLDQLVVALAGFEAAGSRAGDRIEHASVVAPTFHSSIRALGLTVVTQPGFVRARGEDYRRDVAAEELSWLYPCASLLREDIPVAAGTDAPHGPMDPWLAIATAIDRKTTGGNVLGADERVDPRRALDLFLGSARQPGHPRRVEVGQPGDLCLLHETLEDTLVSPCADAVAGTVVGGKPVG
ncbi:MAG: putative amidohydrolase YtcJ [Pseudonocardiales bacterium]|nr:putative amidohydrolase YtcJ [Pseudonocardiales bacterium]